MFYYVVYETFSRVIFNKIAAESEIFADIVEFFDVFKEKVVYTDKRMQQIVLAAWTVKFSIFQSRPIYPTPIL